MTERKWIILLLTTVLGVSGAAAGVNRYVNIFGLFGNVRGKAAVIYSNERTSKYLFSYNYIPTNFDSVLIGTSVTDNWNTGIIKSVRMYNASIDGGDISEEHLILDNYLRRRRPRVIMLCIHPYLTSTYGRKTGFMNPQEYWGALGSIQLLQSYFAWISVHQGWERQRFNAYGQDDFPPPRNIAAGVQGVVNNPFQADPRALDEYQRVVDEAHRSGALTIGVIPPVRMDQWKIRSREYREYQHLVLKMFGPSDLIIDFNRPEYDGLRESPNNFYDLVHISDKVTPLLVREVDRLISKRLEENRLQAQPSRIN